LLIFGLTLLFAGSHRTDAQSEEPTSFMEAQTWGSAVKVMTRNLYIGADVDRILEAEDASEVPLLALQAYQVMLSTDFNRRADALAEEIVADKPHLIGIQEATKIFIQEDGDFLMGNPKKAKDLLYNYWKILMRKLDARLGKGYYRLVAWIKNADVELPMINPTTLETTPSTFWDIRVVDMDMIFARWDVKIRDKFRKNYQVKLEIPEFSIEVPRGYCAVTATVKNKTYKFVNTHLEPYKIEGLFPYIQRKQAQELMADLANEELPIILVGDFNTKAPFGLTYLLISSHGYKDVWLKRLNRGNRRGYTNPHDEDLRNTRVKFNQRIDLIFAKSQVGIGGLHLIGPVYAWVVGDELSDRIEFPGPGGPELIWPSDHAGVIAKLRIPVR